MPSRNVTKFDLPDAFYHVYGRGKNKSAIFRDDQDSRVFLSLFKRYLSGRPHADPYGVAYPHLTGHIDLICYCLMANHFHLLVYQRHPGSMARLMRGVLTSYSRYFNTKYNYSGALLESRYKAALIGNEAYLRHITRYIHLSPHHWEVYEYSSLPFYLGAKRAEWLKPESILALFKTPDDYATFLRDYADHKLSLQEIVP
jgi:putative transposase